MFIKIKNCKTQVLTAALMIRNAKYQTQFVKTMRALAAMGIYGTATILHVYLVSLPIIY